MRMTGIGTKNRLLLLGIRFVLLVLGILTFVGFMVVSLRLQVDPSDSNNVNNPILNNTSRNDDIHESCASVEEMGEVYGRGDDVTAWKESLRVRRLIHRHLLVNGASRIRQLPPDQFCHHGFVIAKASEAGIGNEMYKILTGAALSIMLNRSFIIGQNRGKYPFGDYITYTNAFFYPDRAQTSLEKEQLYVEIWP